VRCVKWCLCFGGAKGGWGAELQAEARRHASAMAMQCMGMCCPAMSC
jgi:hypothetical protein